MFKSAFFRSPDFPDFDDVFSETWQTKIMSFEERSRLTNIVTDTDFTCIRILLPGFLKDEISVSVNDNVLSVNAELSNDITDTDFKRRSFFSKPYIDSWTLSPIYDAKNITSKLENGILIINVPRKVMDKDESSKLKIPVE